MLSRHADEGREFPGRRPYGYPHPGVGQREDPPREVVHRDAVIHLLGGAPGRLADRAEVGGVDDRHAFRGKGAVELSLFARHSLHGAEPRKVRGRDVGDQADVRGGDARQPRDLAGGVGAHLHDRRVVLLGQGEEGERHPDQVVPVPRVAQHPAGPGQEAGKHLLRGRFPRASGDGHQRNVPIAEPVGPGQVPQRLHGIADDEDGPGPGQRPGNLFRPRLGDDRGERPFEERFLHEFGPVDPLSRQRDEYRLRPDLPAVRSDDADRFGYGKPRRFPQRLDRADHFRQGHPTALG